MLYPERLRDARLLVGATQEQLADASEVSQAIVSMIERGDRALTEDLAQKFAGSLGLPIAFFRVAPSTIPDSAVDFRKFKSSLAKDTNRARVLFKEAHRAAVKVLVDAEYPLPTLPYLQSREYPLTKDEVESVAISLRTHLQIGVSAPIPNVTRSLERRGVAIAPLVVPGTDEDPMASVQHFGASHWAGLDEPAVVGYFAGSSGDRDRFTLSHELAHVVAHTFRQQVPVDVREDEANQIASAFLFPRDRVLESMGSDSKLKSLAELKATWGMSMQAIIMRGKFVGAITDTHAASLFKQISARGWRKSEPVHVPHETPVLLRTLLERKYGANPFRSPDIEDDLALPRAIISSMTPGLSGIDQKPDRDNVRFINFEPKVKPWLPDRY